MIQNLFKLNTRTFQQILKKSVKVQKSNGLNCFICSNKNQNICNKNGKIGFNFCSSKNNSFDQKKLQQQVAQYELRTLNLHESDPQIQEVIFDLTQQLETETNFPEIERNLILYLNIGDINMRSQQKDAAREGLMDLIEFLKVYEGDLDLKNHLFPQALHRLGAIFSQDSKLEEAAKFYEQAINMIEEFAQNSPEDQPISIDQVKLLSNSYEKMANILRSTQKFEQAIQLYSRSAEINDQAFPESHPFALKVQTFLGDSLRKQEKNKESIAPLEKAFKNIQMDNQSNASLYIIASQSLIMAHLALNQMEQVNNVLQESEQKFEKHQEFVPVLSLCNFHHLKAIVFKQQNLNEKAKQSLSISLSLAKSILPEGHQMIQKLESFKV